MTLRERARTPPVAVAGHWAASIFCLLVPAIINGSPLLYPDTRAYFIGGRTAVEKALSVVSPASGGGGGLAETLQRARGVRSAFYSLFVYIPTISVSLWMVIVLQALILTAMLRFIFRLWNPDRGVMPATIFMVLLSAFSTTAWATSVVMPDIFTAIMALAIATLLTFWLHLSRLAVWLLFVAIAFALVMHISNLPIGLGLAIVGLFVCKPVSLRRPAFMLCGLAGLLAVVAMLAVSIVGFKRVSLAPQAPPFLLARSLSDGPGRLYLQAHCPDVGFVMCQHLDKLNLQPEIFLWDKTDGVYSVVDTAEQAALRAEGNRIFVAAALEYPQLQTLAMISNALVQLTSFGFYEYSIPSHAVYSNDDMTLYISDQAPWQGALSIFNVFIVGVSLLVVVVRWGTLLIRERQFVLMVLATVLLEAAMGAISEPAPRYEARVMWLVPMVALLIAIRDVLMRHDLRLVSIQWRE
jgi:hypothetical protein